MNNQHIDPLYSNLIVSLLKNGKPGANPRGMPTVEMYNVGWKITDARNSVILNPKRNINKAYAIIEMLGLFQNSHKNVEPYCYYNSQMKNYLNEETGTWDGSYADRLVWYNQLKEMYKVLKADPCSRRAVISLYNPAHDFHAYESRDLCCTLSLIFRLRDNKLHLTCTMRSNDILLGVPYDLTQFTFLQSVLAKWLGVEMGEYYHFTANLHAYEKDLPRLEGIAKSMVTERALKEPFATMPEWDLESVADTFEDIERLFAVEAEGRIDPTPSKLKRLKINAGSQLKSKVLLSFLEDVIFPKIASKAKIPFTFPARAV